MTHLQCVVLIEISMLIKAEVRVATIANTMYTVYILYTVYASG